MGYDIYVSVPVYTIFPVIHSRPEVAPMLAWDIVRAWTTSRDALLNGRPPSCGSAQYSKWFMFSLYCRCTVLVPKPSWEYVLPHRSYKTNYSPTEAFCVDYLCTNEQACSQ
jgi:hypothetical protein